MFELLLIAGIVGLAGYGILRLVLKQRRARRAMIAQLQARGWHWLDQVPDVDLAGAAPVLPGWLRPAQIAALRVRDIHRVSYANFYCGEAENLPICGFDRTARRRRGKSEGHYSTWQALSDVTLPEDFPEFFLVRAHFLTNALAGLDDRMAALEGGDYRLRHDVPGFEGWRVHATPAGLQWLSSGAGASLAQALQGFDAVAQHAFGVSGQVLLAQGMSGSVAHIDALTADLLSFRRLLQQALDCSDALIAGSVIR